MWAVLLLALMWAVFAGPSSAHSTSHWDLEGGNRTCDDSRSFSGDQYQLTRSVFWTGCSQCDQQFVIFRDYYIDFENSSLGASGWGEEWVTGDSGGGLRIDCERTSSLWDPVSAFPATDLRTGTTYHNLFCAICHRVEELDVCPSIPPSNSLTSQKISKLLYFNEDRSSWGLDLNDGFHSCSIDPSIPEASDQLFGRCIPEAIKTYTENVEVHTTCDAYTTVMYEGYNIYRKLNCIVCNNAPLQILQCFKISFQIKLKKHFSPSAFSVLFDLRNDPPGKIQPCNDHQLYDRYFKRCRSVLKELQEPIPDLRSIQQPKPDPLSIRQFYDTSNLTTPISKCAKLLLNENEYVLGNNTVYIAEYKKIFRRGEFNIIKGGGLEICSENIGVKFVSKFDKYMIITTFVGLGISVVFLIMHLTAFCLVSEVRNLPGKNLASLCVALLLGYISFMVGQVLRGTSCIVIAVITFYSFLASFMWMLTISFDVWYAIRLSTTELRRHSDKKKRGRFIVYSLWAWLLPAAIVLLAVWTELSPRVATDWRPGFATSSCWFGRSKPLLVFFVIPLALVMLFNIAFFSNSAYMINSTRSYLKPNSGAQRDFRLYLRLAVMMGLTWIMGLVAGTLDINLLWYLFVILNTLQGFFIFLAFTWNDKDIRGLAICGGTKPALILYSINKDMNSHMESKKKNTILH